MASRLDKIEKLTAGLAALSDPDPAPASRPAAPQTVPPPVDGTRRGRPPVDTVAMNLRLPTPLRDRAAIEAGRRSQAQRRNVTPQSVILELMDKHLPPLPDAEAPDPAGTPGRG